MYYYSAIRMMRVWVSEVVAFFYPYSKPISSLSKRRGLKLEDELRKIEPFSQCKYQMPVATFFPELEVELRGKIDFFRCVNASSLEFEIYEVKSVPTFPINAEVFDKIIKRATLQLSLYHLILKREHPIINNLKAYIVLAWRGSEVEYRIFRAQTNPQEAFCRLEMYVNSTIKRWLVCSSSSETKE